MIIQLLFIILIIVKNYTFLYTALPDAYIISIIDLGFFLSKKSEVFGRIKLHKKLIWKYNFDLLKKVISIKR